MYTHIYRIGDIKNCCVVLTPMSLDLDMANSVNRRYTWRLSLRSEHDLSRIPQR